MIKFFLFCNVINDEFEIVLEVCFFLVMKGVFSIFVWIVWFEWFLWFFDSICRLDDCLCRENW